MKLCLDGRTITTHFPGIGRYTFNLTRRLTQLLNKDEQLILLRNPTWPSLWDLTALASKQVEVVDIPVSPFSLRQQWGIPHLLRRYQADLYHSPYHLMPYHPGVPTIVTVYDLIPLVHPQSVSVRARLFFRWTTKLAVRTAHHIITISAATRRDLVTTYAVPQERITTIPAGVDSTFRPQPSNVIAALRARLCLPEHYVLYVGINKPHKNLVRLIDAWALVIRSSISGYDLVIAGYEDPRYREARNRAAALDLDTVRFLGNIAEADLPVLYSGAALFVFPSLYEGFGLPVLEAMACGAPVACSNTSSLPEVAGQAAVLFDPVDVEAIAAAMMEMLRDADRRAELARRGRERAAQFSWEQTARQTLSAYYRTLI
jgi:alpha-1,3-rhamnosyl/mannosyltransferase